MIILTDEQNSALSELKKWSTDQTYNGLFCLLSGHAGTGKTTIVKYLLESLTGELTVSAPTHKALNVISSSVGKPGITVHNLLGLAPNYSLEDFDPNKITFDPNGTEKIQVYDFVIIDEAGAILNSKLIEYIFKQAGRYNTKILFIGDSMQLPPIGELESIIFSSDKIKYKVVLYTIQRTKNDNPIIDIYSSIIKAKNDQNLDNLYLPISKLNSNGEGIEFYNDFKEFVIKIGDLYRDLYWKQKYNNIRMLTWTNDNVAAWNLLIREQIFKGHYTDRSSLNNEIRDGELITGYRTITKREKNGTITIILQNSVDYTIEFISEKKTNRSGISGFEVIIKPITGINTLTSKIFIVDLSDDDNRDLFFKKLMELKDKALMTTNTKYRKCAWQNYFAFKDKHVTMKTIVDGNGKALIYKDIDFSYAITVHKAQGSTYEYTAINERNMVLNSDTIVRNKMLFTAFTRTKSNSYVLTNRSVV